MLTAALPLLLAMAAGPQAPPPSILSTLGELNRRQAQAEASSDAQHTKPFPWETGTTVLLWTGGAIGAMDISRSMYEIGAGRAYETNPLLAPFVDVPEGFAAAKLAGNAAVTTFLYYVKKKNPKAAFWGAVAYNVIGAAVVAHNWRTAVLSRSR